jgi:hypothetical protein
VQLDSDFPQRSGTMMPQSILDWSQRPESQTMELVSPPILIVILAGALALGRGLVQRAWVTH